MIARRSCDGLTDGFEPALELGQIDLLEPLVHDLPALFPLGDDVRADFRERVLRHSRPRVEFIKQRKRHVELSNGPERLGQPADLPPRLSRLTAVQSGRQHGHGFPEPPGCDSCLMYSDVIARQGVRHVTLERAGPTVEEAKQRRRTVHGRMRAARAERPVYTCRLLSKVSATSPAVRLSGTCV